MGTLSQYGLSTFMTDPTAPHSSLPPATNAQTYVYSDLFADIPTISSASIECCPLPLPLSQFKDNVNRELNTHFDSIKMVSCSFSHPFTFRNFGVFANMDKIALFGKDVVIDIKRQDSEHGTVYELSKGEIILIPDRFWDQYDIAVKSSQVLALEGVQLLVLFAASSELQSRDISSAIDSDLEFIPYNSTSLSSDRTLSDAYYSVNSRHIQERTHRHEVLLSKWAEYIRNLHPGLDLLHNNFSRTCRCDLLWMSNGVVVINEIKSLDETKQIDELKQARNAYGQLAMYEYSLKRRSSVAVRHRKEKISVPKNAKFMKVAVFEQRLRTEFFVEWLNNADIKVVYFEETTGQFKGDVDQVSQAIKGFRNS